MADDENHHARIQEVFLPTLFYGVFFFLFFCLVDEGREDPYTSIADHHRTASQTPFKWRFAGVTMMSTH